MKPCAVDGTINIQELERETTSQAMTKQNNPIGYAARTFRRGGEESPRNFIAARFSKMDN